MPLVGAPTFSPGILTADQLNSLVALLEAKFAGGITTEDIAFPLIAGGNIDMNNFELLHLARLWNVRNLAERDSTASVQDVLDDIDAEGGGVALLPSGHTETLGVDGVTIGSNTLIMGEGETSVFATAGTLTGHMFSNKANGDSDIQFFNLKITNEGTAGGVYNMVNLQRVSKARFTDVTLVVDAQNGVVLTSDAAGTSCVNTRFLRCDVTVQDAGLAGIQIEDAQDFTFLDGRFFVDNGGSAVTIDPVDTTSNAENIAIINNKLRLNFNASSSMFDLVGPTGTTIRGLDVTENMMISETDSSAIFINVENLAGGHINSNRIQSDFDVSIGIRIQNSLGFTVSANQMGLSGAGMGILIGGDSRSGTAASCIIYTVADNVISASEDTCIALVHPGSGNMDVTFRGNIGLSSGAVGTFEMWNLGADPTLRTFQMTITGNRAGTDSTAGWISYVGMGTTRGGEMGAANGSRLAVTCNIFPDTVFSDAGSGNDFHDSQSSTVDPLYVHGQNVIG